MSLASTSLGVTEDRTVNRRGGIDKRSKSCVTIQTYQMPLSDFAFYQDNHRKRTHCRHLMKSLGYCQEMELLQIDETYSSVCDLPTIRLLESTTAIPHTLLCIMFSFSPKERMAGIVISATESVCHTLCVLGYMHMFTRA